MHESFTQLHRNPTDIQYSTVHYKISYKYVYLLLQLALAHFLEKYHLFRVLVISCNTVTSWWPAYLCYLTGITFVAICTNTINSLLCSCVTQKSYKMYMQQGYIRVLQSYIPKEYQTKISWHANLKDICNFKFNYHYHFYNFCGFWNYLVSTVSTSIVIW